MRVFCFRRIAILSLALALAFCGECPATDLITLTPSSAIITKGEVSFKIAAQVLVPPTATPAAFAGVVLLTGGDGVLGLDAQGRITEQGGNFLIRSAYRFLNAGMNVAILNARSSLTNSDRLSVGHAMYVTSAIAAARKRWSKAGTGGSVWLVGTSNGTISTFNVAARIAANASPRCPRFPTDLMASSSRPRSCKAAPLRC
jgi:hypothetical protein